MIQKVNQKLIFSFLLIDFIKQQEDFLREVQKKTGNLDSKVFKTKNGTLIMQSKSADCGIKSQDLRNNKKQKDYSAI